jgi:hypothetical protein
VVVVASRGHMTTHPQKVKDRLGFPCPTRGDNVAKTGACSLLHHFVTHNNLCQTHVSGCVLVEELHDSRARLQRNCSSLHAAALHWIKIPVVSIVAVNERRNRWCDITLHAAVDQIEETDVA